MMYHKKLGLVASAALLLLAVFSCNLDTEDGHTYLNIKKDTAWSGYDSLEITWKDSATLAGGILFRGDPETLDAVNKFNADGYAGREIGITVRGFNAGKLVYEQRIGFSGDNPEHTSKVVVLSPDTGKAKPDTATVKPDTTITKPDTTAPVANPSIKSAIETPRADTVISIGDSIPFLASASVDTGSLRDFAWGYEGKSAFGAAQALAGRSARINGGFRYGRPGDYRAILRVTAAGGTSGECGIRVLVLLDAPKADAGKDTTVYTGAKVKLHGTGLDGLGQIGKTEWKIGDDPFVSASTDTSFLAPAAPGELAAYFRVTDDDGQTATDTMLVHIISTSGSNLADLGVSAGRLAPQFNPAVLAYADTVPFDTDSITVFPAGTGILTVEGRTVASGAASRPIDLKVGDNIVSIIAKAEGSPAKTYLLTVHRSAPSPDADLAMLKVSAGPLDKPFAPGDTSYTVQTGNATLSTTLTPTSGNGTATLILNGSPTRSGAESREIGLNVGPNTLSLTVTAQSGARKTYTIVVVRAKIGNTNLANLELSAGKFAPAFSPGTLEYSLALGNPVATTTVTAELADSASTLTINAAKAESKVPYPVDLDVGANSIKVAVTSRDGTTKGYTVRVTRAGNANTNLSALSSSSGPLQPVFDPDSVFYTLSVPNDSATSAVSAKVADSNSTVAINGKVVASGSPISIDLAVGPNPIAVAVTAQNGSKKSYSLVVTRAANANPDLQDLLLAAGPISPAFRSDVSAYSRSAAFAEDSAKITATAAARTSKLTINGASVASGFPSPSIALNVGVNAIPVVVTSESGATRTYTLTITRAKDTNADLRSLAVSAGTLRPGFDAAVPAYKDTVGNDKDIITLTPLTASIFASVTVNGTLVPRGSASGAITLKVGDNPIPVVVTSQSGSTKAYAVTVTRQTNGNANLIQLALSAGELSPGFDSAVVAYTATVAHDVTSITVKPKVWAATSAVTVKGIPVPAGSASGNIALAVGDNPIPVTVTAEDGKSAKTYTVVVKRALSDTATLSGLTVSSGATDMPLSTAFYAYTADYFCVNAISAASVKIKPTATNPGGAITVNGDPVASGAESKSISLSASGTTTVAIEVTAPDGVARKSYSILFAKPHDFAYTVGAEGTIRASLDGIAWSPRNSGSTKLLYSIAWTNSLLITVGEDGEILTSPDGVAWTRRISGTAERLFYVMWNGTQAVASGTAGTILTSPDGIAWTVRKVETAGQFKEVVWTGSQFVATGSDGDFWTSPDAIAWTWRPAAENLGGTWFLAIAWTGTQLVAGSSTGIIMTSPDGIRWTRQADAPRGIESIIWTGTQLVAVGFGGMHMTSPDGVNWTSRAALSDRGLLTVRMMPGKLVAIGDYGHLETSPNGVTWTEHVYGSGTSLYGLVW